MRNKRLGGAATANLAFLRERVERQRSVVVSGKGRTGSLEDLNCDLRNDVENTRNSVERLDTQISTLHQDVATLSMEVGVQVYESHFFEFSPISSGLGVSVSVK